MGNGTTPSDQEIKKRRSKSCSRYFLTAPNPRAEAISFTERGLTSDQLKKLAKESEAIIIGAFDGEGYLIWKKGV